MFRARADNHGVRTTFLLAAAIGCTLASCARAKDGASCGEAAGRFFAIASAEIAAAPLDDTTRRRARDQLPAMRDALDAQCKEQAWSKTIRGCLAQAADHVAIQTCERDLTDAQKAALDRSTRGEEAW